MVGGPPRGGGRLCRAPVLWRALPSEIAVEASDQPEKAGSVPGRELALHLRLWHDARAVRLTDMTCRSGENIHTIIGMVAPPMLLTQNWDCDLRLLRVVLSVSLTPY